MTDDERISLSVIESCLASPLSNEQREFAADFTHPTIAFASPGTGKTYTLVAGILNALTLKGVSGDRFKVISFTNAATNEIAARYEKVQKVYQPHLKVKDRSKPFSHPEFSTLHSFMLSLLKSVAPDLSVVGQLNIKDSVEYISQLLLSKDLPNSYDYARKLFDNMNRMNSAFIYSQAHCEQDSGFMSLNISYEDFQEIRMRYFSRNYANKVIPQGDIPLYALYALSINQDLYNRWHNYYDIIVVDEFQDMTLLYLHLLRLLTKSLVAVGDMKQQIYVFNGASILIRHEYLKSYPDAKICNLTKSFRCSKAVTNLANSLLTGSMLRPEMFEGTDVEGSAEVLPYSKQLLTTLAEDAKNKALRDTMFLFRLNASIVPIIDALYENNIPYQCPKYTPIHELPVMKELSTLMDMGIYPNDPERVDKGLRLLPEFERARWGTLCYPAKMIKEKGLSLFSLPEGTFKSDVTKQILNAVKRAADEDEKNVPAATTLNYILQTYGKLVMARESWKYPMPIEYYISMCAEVMKKYSYFKMVRREQDKISRANEYRNAVRVVRCYTCHSAKGLEAADVYVLDADDNIFPSHTKIDKKIDKGFSYEALCDIQAERNLLYVAATRAKENLKVFYFDKPTCLLDFEHSVYNKLYDSAAHVDVDFKDYEAFLKVVKL